MKYLFEGRQVEVVEMDDSYNDLFGYTGMVELIDEFGANYLVSYADFLYKAVAIEVQK
ncbi:hypothetical protein ACFBZI_08490 [Moraxella sp. ZJ142]|uniref:hypothetical protein n=1 Tax=Moraxella marmotae TaxID=3344520 RepID=UPI0035D42FF4